MINRLIQAVVDINLLFFRYSRSKEKVKKKERQNRRGKGKREFKA